MNIDLSRIIRESIDDLICDDIISEAIDDVVLLTEANKYKKGLKPARDARYAKEIAQLRKKAKKLGLQDKDIDKLSDVKLKNLIKQAKEENKNKNLTQTGPVKTDDAKELDKNSSVDGVDTHTGTVDSTTTENPEGKGREIPVEPTTGEGTPATGEKPTDGEKPTIMPTINDDGESANGEKPTNDGDPINDGKPADSGENQNEETQEAAKQLLEKYDFKKYSDKLRQLIGNGIDPQPVADDKNAVQFVQQFNQFLFDVINAIESGNLLREPSTGGNGKNAAQFTNPYTKSKYDGFYNALHSLLTTGAEAFDQAVGTTDLTNAVFGGMGAAFNKGYHQMVNATNDFINNRAYLQSMANNNAAAAGGNAKQGLSLSDLMLPNGCQYIIMLGSYQNVNSSSNNKLNTIAVIPQAFQVLEQLREELYRFQQEAQQTAQKVAQQNGGNQGESDRKPRPNYSRYVKLIDEQYQNVDEEANNEELNKETITALGVVGDLLYNVKLAIIDKLYYPEDIKDDKQGGKPLTTLMSLDDNANTYDNATYISANGHYQGLYDYFNGSDRPESNSVRIIGNAMDVLTKLREQMKNDGVIENYREPGGKIPENGGEQIGDEEQENDKRSGREIMEERGKEYLPILTKQLEFCNGITDPNSVKNFFKEMARIRPEENTLDTVYDVQIKLEEIINALNNNVYTNGNNTTEIYNSEWVKPLSDALYLDNQYGDINWFYFNKRYEDALDSANKRDKKLLSNFKNIIDTLDQLRNEMISQKMYEDDYGYYRSSSSSD